MENKQALTMLAMSLPCSSDHTYAEWTMYLQRYQPDPNDPQLPPNPWETIGTRTDYVSSDSSSHRTFTNVGNNGTIRVLVLFKRSAYHQDFEMTHSVR